MNATHFTIAWCGIHGDWTDEDARQHAASCEDCTTMREAFEDAQHEVQHTSWCNAHRVEDDGSDRIEVCRREVTIGEASVLIEDSPAWADDPLHVGAISPPQWNECDAAGARDLAAALIEAARLIEDDPAS